MTKSTMPTPNAVVTDSQSPWEIATLYESSLAIAAGGPAAAQAQAASDNWCFQAAIYGWFPAISGQTAVPLQTEGEKIDVRM